jgi:hypothetical protein
MRGRLDRILTAVLGPKCEHGCGHRVFTKDRAEHRTKYCHDVAVQRRKRDTSDRQSRAQVAGRR